MIFSSYTLYIDNLVISSVHIYNTILPIYKLLMYIQDTTVKLLHCKNSSVWIIGTLTRKLQM